MYDCSGAGLAQDLLFKELTLSWGPEPLPWLWCKFLAISAPAQVNFKTKPGEPEIIILNGPAKWAPSEVIEVICKTMSCIGGFHVQERKSCCVPICDLPVVLRKCQSVFPLPSSSTRSHFMFSFKMGICASEWNILLSTRIVIIRRIYEYIPKKFSICWTSFESSCIMTNCKLHEGKIQNVIMQTQSLSQCWHRADASKTEVE